LGGGGGLGCGGGGGGGGGVWGESRVRDEGKRGGDVFVFLFEGGKKGDGILALARQTPPGIYLERRRRSEPVATAAWGPPKKTLLPGLTSTEKVRGCTRARGGRASTYSVGEKKIKTGGGAPGDYGVLGKKEV